MSLTQKFGLSRRLSGVSLLLGLLILPSLADAAGVTLIDAGQPRAAVHIVPAQRTPAEQAAMEDAGKWLTDALTLAAGATVPAAAEMPAGPAIVLATVSEHQPAGADLARLRASYDAYAIATEGQRLWLVGNNPYALHHAVAHLLRELGFRYYAPSARWHIVPQLSTVKVDLNVTDAPDLSTRSIWYAYGNPIGDLTANYRRWAQANRLSLANRTNNGHSYGHIINRNLEAFTAHPEYFALQPDGTRHSVKSPAAAKFCFSNPGLIELVVNDRLKHLEELRQSNPLAYMVSCDPSDGQGTCYCENCVALGTTTDRVFSLANHVARALRAKYPDAWVGLYAYSSHRLPPTIDLEPNVYVQVAMGFNRTEYSLPELVSLWSQKVGAIGLREYYGVQAWDWGLPGRMRGSKVDYHRQWIPYYAQRKLNAVNAETNANWGAQMLGLDVAAALMWDVDVDVDALVNAYFTDCFGTAAAPIRALYDKFDLGSPLQPATLLPMFKDVQQAATLSSDPQVQARLNDLMAYLVYVEEYRRFSLVEAARPQRDDLYYQALLPLMNYAWRIRERDMVHYYALARRLCNGLPKTDNRLDFFIGNKEQAPVFQQGEAYTDAEIAARFTQLMEELAADADANVTFSRYLEPASPAGADAGPGKLFVGEETGVISLRGNITGYLVPGAASSYTLAIKPTGRRAVLTVYARGDDVLTQQEATDKESYTELQVALPKAGEYRWTLEGNAVLRAGPEVPLIYEASVFQPAWVEYSGPSYFYVPRGTREVLVAGSPRLSVWVPGAKQRLDVNPSIYADGKQYCVIPVPQGAAGTVWHTDPQTRGHFMLLNIPPLLSLHRNQIFVPREVAEADRLTTAPR